MQQVVEHHVSLPGRKWLRQQHDLITLITNVRSSPSGRSDLPKEVSVSTA
jgi:hypothetical protein